MEAVLNELLSINIDEFVEGIRKETGSPEELTQNLWYVWSPIGEGKTKLGKKNSFYGERAMCVNCEIFSWDLSLSAPVSNIATICSNCVPLRTFVKV